MSLLDRQERDVALEEISRLRIELNTVRGENSRLRDVAEKAQKEWSEAAAVKTADLIRLQTELERLQRAPQTADGVLAARLNAVERERDAAREIEEKARIFAVQMREENKQLSEALDDARTIAVDLREDNRRLVDELDLARDQLSAAKEHDRLTTEIMKQRSQDPGVDQILLDAIEKAVERVLTRKSKPPLAVGQKVRLTAHTAGVIGLERDVVVGAVTNNPGAADGLQVTVVGKDARSLYRSVQAGDIEGIENYELPKENT